MTEIKIVAKDAGEYMGQWATNDPGLIWLNVKTIWDWAATNSPPRATQDDIEDRFCKKLGAIFLQERICIQRSLDKLRLKGGMCNPYCRHEKLVDLMVHPEEWSDVRDFHRAKKIRSLADSESED